MINIPQKLKEVRNKAGITQRELGGRLSIDERIIGSYESGTRKAGWQIIQKWYKACGFDIVDFKLKKSMKVKGIEITAEVLVSVGFKAHKEGYLYDSPDVDLFLTPSRVMNLDGGVLSPPEGWSVFINRTGRNDVAYLHELNQQILPELGFELKIEEK